MQGDFRNQNCGSCLLVMEKFLFSVKICEVCILNDIKGDTTLQRQKCAVYGGEKVIWKKRKIRLKMM